MTNSELWLTQRSMAGRSVADTTSTMSCPMYSSHANSRDVKMASQPVTSLAINVLSSICERARRSSDHDGIIAKCHIKLKHVDMLFISMDRHWHDISLMIVQSVQS